MTEMTSSSAIIWDDANPVDLGNGHVGFFILYHGRAVGLHERHPHDAIPDGCCGGGYIAWEAVGGLVAKHQLVSGGPDDIANFTVSPSLWHRHRCTKSCNCGGSVNSPAASCHGFIRKGRWEPA